MPTFTWLQIEVMKMQSIEMHCFFMFVSSKHRAFQSFLSKAIDANRYSFRKAIVRRYMWTKLGRTFGGGGGGGGLVFLKRVVDMQV
jgi:hypothetical protein